MKRYLLFLGLIMTVFTACKKTTEDKSKEQAKLDEAQIVAYLTANNITAVKDASGLYYQVITPGSAAKPTATSGVYITYDGTLMSTGVSFDSKTTPYYFPSLDKLIQGWQIGLPKIGKGGHIKLFMPSGLAYGKDGAGSVPANAVLIFDITLVDFN